ncbi:hypothetical protein LEN26_018838 [Aphanomyces euteiches]|nr:hypothetical protein LEN26_018838 [Aphanomyces euteiches]
MRSYSSAELTQAERRLAAMISLPTPTPATEMYNMVIACKSAVATFPLSVLLDSLATTQQSALWITAKGMCRDFVRIKNVGISFNCTDRDMVTKLGCLKLNLCGRQFPIRVFSEYSHLYWIDLTLAADVQAEDVWSYFDALGDAPVLIKSSFDKNSIQSRHLTLYFATREPPASLMFGEDKPVREIYVHGTDSAPSFVHHHESMGQDHESQASQEDSQQPQPDNMTPDQRANADNQSQSEGMQDASMSSGNSSWAESSDSESDDAASDTHSASSQHRIPKYNKGLPPSIKAQRNKKQEATDETEAKHDDPPPSTDQQQQDESMGQDHESQASQEA